MFYVILYLVLALLGGLFAILYTQYAIAVFVGILILFPIITYILSLIPCLFMEVSFVEDNRAVHKGEEFKIQITLKNNTVFPIIYGNIRYQYGYGIQDKWTKGKMPFQLRGKSKTQYTLTLKSEYCGTIGIQIYKIIVKDFFRIIPFSIRRRAMFKQPVLPDLEVVPLEVTKSVSFYNDEYDEFYEDHPGNDPSEIFEIRDYKEGDKLQRIHWKLSSKKDKLMVKEFSDPIVINTMVLCDTCYQYGGMQLVRDWSEMLEKVVRASYTLVQQEVNHYVCWFDDRDESIVKREIKSIVDFNTCMSQIVQLKSNDKMKEFLDYLRISGGIENFANIFYVGKNAELFEQNRIHVKVVD